MGIFEAGPRNSGAFLQGRDWLLLFDFLNVGLLKKAQIYIQLKELMNTC